MNNQTTNQQGVSMTIKISQHVRDAIASGRVNSAQCAQIADTINKFSVDSSMTADAEIVFIDNAAYRDLKDSSSGADKRRQGFYSDGSPKIWIATSWSNGCNGKNGPKIFKGRQGNMTEWVSIRTYLR